LNGGFQTVIQDGGRYGCQGLGITTGGPMDCHSFAWANRLLANEVTLPTLEVCLGNFSAQFEADTCFSLTGADLQWRLDGEPIRPWRSHCVKAGAVISCASVKNGLRGYLAVHGGFIVPEVFKSCATVAGDQLGGLHNGEKLKLGDQVSYGKCTSGQLRRTPEKFIPSYNDNAVLRIAPTNQYELFQAQTIRKFLSNTYKISSRTDRMGCRLQGTPLTDLPGNMISEAVPLGAIQVPKDGQPIILLQDRPTIGGYPKLGNVYAVDLNSLAQLKPGDKVQFQLGDLAEAQHELSVFRKFFQWHLPVLNTSNKSDKNR